MILGHGVGHLAVAQGKHQQGRIAGGEYFIQLHLAHEVVASLPRLPGIGAVQRTHGHVLRTHAHNAVLVHAFIVHTQHGCPAAHGIVWQAVFKTRRQQVECKTGQRQNNAQQGIAPG